MKLPPPKEGGYDKLIDDFRTKWQGKSAYALARLAFTAALDETNPTPEKLRPLDAVGAQEFFNLLLATTLQGFFADPVYGGNRDKAAWKMIGFPGVIAIYSEHIKTYRNKKFDVEPKSILDLS